MSKSNQHSQDVEPEERQFKPVQSEINLLRYPLWNMRFDREDLEPKTYVLVYDDRDEGYFAREWTVIPTVALGPPGPIDQDVFTSVEELVARKGGMPKDGQIEFTLAELRGILGWSKSGRSNGLIRESLQRIAMTSIVTRNAFYSKDTDSYVSDTFTIWSVHFAESKGKRGRATNHRLKFHDLFVNNFLCQYIKGQDTSLYWALENPIAKRLYRLIDEQRAGELSWQIDVHELARRIPLKEVSYKSTILKRLAASHKELVEGGFLERVEQNGKMLRYVIDQGFARRQRAQDMSEDPRQSIALELLLSLQVRGDTARELVFDYGADRCIYYAKAAPYQKIKRSRSGWLIEAIKEGYELGEKQMPPPSPAEPEMETLFSMDELSGEDGDCPEVEDGSEEETQSAVSREPDPVAEEIWERVLDDISEQINAPSLRVWFEGTKAVGLTEDSLTICVPNSFAKEYIESRFKDIIEPALSEHLSPPSILEIVVATGSKY